MAATDPIRFQPVHLPSKFRPLRFILRCPCVTSTIPSVEREANSLLAKTSGENVLPGDPDVVYLWRFRRNEDNEMGLPVLRIIGDVHSQILPEDVVGTHAQSYSDIIAGAGYSVQVGDMGDGETYEQLNAHVDGGRHRFFPGNHDHYNRLPPHCLGDFGPAECGGIRFFFIRGARSADREKLLQMGRDLGRILWFEEEELREDQMRQAEQAYLAARPEIVLSHDAPTDIARHAWKFARRFKAPNPTAAFRPSGTNAFLTRLLDRHAPRLWMFGHHHHDWRYREGPTLFVCVGELSYLDIDSEGQVPGTTMRM